MELTIEQLAYIETKLGWQIGLCGLDRAEQLMSLGATLDEVVEALTLL